MKKGTKAMPAKALLQIIAISAILFLGSCATKMHFMSSPVVPAATGEVKLKTDKNNNTHVELSVNNLAASDKLTPSRQAYVVWMVTEANGTKNIGQLNSSTGFLSSKLKASMETVTAFKPVSFFISAEDNGNVQYPGTQIVLSTGR